MKLWKNAIALAKSGNRTGARELFRQLTRLEPSNSLVWQWLASTSDPLEEKAGCLRKVLHLEPGNQKVRIQFQRVLFRLGMEYAKTNQRERARTYFQEILRWERNHEKAWHWLASVSDTAEEREVCLRKALALNPENSAARDWLKKRKIIKQQKQKNWACPFCETAYPHIQDQCNQCGAHLSLRQIDIFFQDRYLDEEILRNAVGKLKQKTLNGHSFHDRLHLSLAHFNLQQVDLGLSQLILASQLRPDDGALKSAIALIQLKYKDEQPAETDQEETADTQDTLMVVDDSSTVRKLISLTFERLGYQVISAASGNQALSKLNETIPGLILLDICMPHMDGYQVCRIIKGNVHTKDVPVIMLTGQDGFFDKVRGRMAGAKDYITKPFEAATIIHAVEKNFRRIT